MSSPWLPIAVVAALSCHARAQEGGIEIFAGETLFETGWRTSLTYLYKPRHDLYRGTNEVPDPLARRFIENRVVLGLDYGLDRNSTLTLLLPHVDRELRSGGTTMGADGLGDVALIGKRRFVREEWHAGSFNWAMVGGLEMPTGATDAEQGGVRLPPGVQVGTGAWNPFLATAATLDIKRARFDASVFYKWNTEGAQQFEAGDFFSIDLSAAYRFLHFKYPGPTYGFRLGLQWRHEGRAESSGSAVTNSGADELLLRPALSVHPTPDTDLNLGVRIPIYQDYNGEQLARGVELFIAVGLRF